MVLDQLVREPSIVVGFEEFPCQGEDEIGMGGFEQPRVLSADRTYAWCILNRQGADLIVNIQSDWLYII